MRETEKRLRMLLRDLSRLEADLLSAGWYEEHGGNGQNTAVFADLKSALDNLRTSLWCRIQASSAVNRDAVIGLIEDHRLSRATELLRSVRGSSLHTPESDSGSPRMSSTQEGMALGRSL